MTEFTRLDIETLINGGAVEIHNFDELHAIPEGFVMVGDYEEPHPEYGYPVAVVRVLKGFSGKHYVYYL